MFSSRVRDHRATNRLAAAVTACRRSGHPFLDLTVTNPTTAGIEYPGGLLRPLADPSALTYAPAPFGTRTARRAVAQDFERRGTGVAREPGVDPERILLTASTSEAYSLLFKLLCEPAGDDVLVPVPSYPLFDHLTALDGVRPVNYRLDYHGRWELDVPALDAAWTERTRAVLAVTPNNPTGSLLSRAELDALTVRCAERDAALIVDEVFADYTFDASPPDSLPARPGALTFRLGGLSKSIGLPQVKLGWILADGPEPAVAEALERLELIADTYLSVSTPVQVAAADLLHDGAIVRERIRARVVGNFKALCRLVDAAPALEVLHADGGWSAVIRVPARGSEEEMVLELLERHRVLVHPGFFFDFPNEAFVVVSLLAEPAGFEAGITRLVEFFDA